MTKHLAVPDWYRAKPTELLSMRQIAHGVSSVTGISLPVMRANRRFQPIVDARHMCYFLAREQGISFPRIAHYFRSDHSTVIYGVRRWREAMAKDATYFDMLVRAYERAQNAPAF